MKRSDFIIYTFLNLLNDDCHLHDGTNMSDGFANDEYNDLYLSDHSLSMRKAYQYCLELFHQSEQTNARASSNDKEDKIRSIFGQICHDVNSLHDASKEHRIRRNAAYHRFWSSLSSTKKSSEKISPHESSTRTRHDISFHIGVRNPTQIDKLDVVMKDKGNHNVIDDATNESRTICPEEVRYFKDRFQNLNLPCLITGLNKLPHFHYVNHHWRNSKIRRSKNQTNASNMKSSSSVSRTNPKITSSSSKVNRFWFRDELGSDCLVPLRYIPSDRNEGSDSEKNSMLDEDGRAIECETKEVSMKEWIHMLEEATTKLEQSIEDDGENKNKYKRHTGNDQVPNELVVYYLKDWHLQQRYPSMVPGQPTPASTRKRKDLLLPDLDPAIDQSCHHSECSLYKTPEIFGHDLLNSFLTRFTDGDYRFCYWGPVRSYTARHSDVLHSFSWSYNVVGTKQWTFYHDDRYGIDGINTGNRNKEVINGSRNDDRLKTFTVVQEAGQTIFVPATWQHKVVNLEETISINHNWITSSNLDLVWDCLLVEMEAIRDELKGWHGGDENGDAQGLDQNTEACENMLRGCIGLDVTGFVLMALVGLLEATMTLLVLVSLPETETLPGNDSDSRRNKGEQHVFDILRITSVLRTVFVTEDNTNLVRVRSRLAAVLQSETMAQNLENMVTTLIDHVPID